MKKVKRIYFVIFLIAILVFSVKLLYTKYDDLFELNNLSDYLDLFVPLSWILFAMPSLMFNLEKLGENITKSKIYPFTRVIDLIALIYFSLWPITGFIALYVESEQIESTGYLYLALFMSIILVTCIFMFIDNLKFHKSFRHIPKSESINDIGESS
jgi:hypothetical protein